MKYAAAMIVLLAAPLVSAPPPKLLCEIDLQSIIPAGRGLKRSAAIAFSPDENWLAVAVGARQIDRRKTNRGVDPGLDRLLLVPVNLAPARKTANQTVEIQLGLRPMGSPAWSPDSAAVLVQGLAPNQPSSHPDAIAKVWDLKGDELWRRPGPGLSAGAPVGGIFGFLDSKRLLARGIPAKGMPAAFGTIDLQGQVIDTWPSPKHWRVGDISAERGLVAVLTEETAKTLIIDYRSKKVVLTRDNPYGYLGTAGGSWQYFTERGKTLCSVGSVGIAEPRFDTATECWDVDSGRKIAQFGGFLGGAPAAASSGGSRLVLSTERVFPKKDQALIFPHGERLVWDFRSGAEIAAWDAPQIVSANGSHFFDAIAISASGRFVAEASGARLRIYELP